MQSLDLHASMRVVQQPLAELGAEGAGWQSLDWSWEALPLASRLWDQPLAVGGLGALVGVPWRCPAGLTLPCTLPQLLASCKLQRWVAEGGYWLRTPLASHLNSQQELEDQDHLENECPVLLTWKR